MERLCFNRWKKMYKYLLFDLDGTLTDSYDGIASGIMYALEKMGVQGYERQNLKMFMGPPLFSSFEKIFGDDSEKINRAVKLYREYFDEIGWKEDRVYDGVPQMLHAFNDMGKIMVVATSKPEHFSRRIVEYFDLGKYFAFVAGASVSPERATKSSVIEYAIKSAGIEKSDALMIGDRNHDILGAKECGLKSMGVLYGYGDRAELAEAGADYIAATPAQVVEIIRKCN